MDYRQSPAFVYGGQQNRNNFPEDSVRYVSGCRVSKPTGTCSTIVHGSLPVSSDVTHHSPSVGGQYVQPGGLYMPPCINAYQQTPGPSIGGYPCHGTLPTGTANIGTGWKTTLPKYGHLPPGPSSAYEMANSHPATPQGSKMIPLRDQVQKRPLYESPGGFSSSMGACKTLTENIYAAAPMNSQSQMKWTPQDGKGHFPVSCHERSESGSQPLSWTLRSPSPQAQVPRLEKSHDTSSRTGPKKRNTPVKDRVKDEDPYILHHEKYGREPGKPKERKPRTLSPEGRRHAAAVRRAPGGACEDCKRSKIKVSVQSCNFPCRGAHN